MVSWFSYTNKVIGNRSAYCTAIKEGNIEMMRNELQCGNYHIEAKVDNWVSMRKEVAIADDSLNRWLFDLLVDHTKWFCRISKQH